MCRLLFVNECSLRWSCEVGLPVLSVDMDLFCNRCACCLILAHVRQYSCLLSVFAGAMGSLYCYYIVIICYYMLLYCYSYSYSYSCCCCCLFVCLFVCNLLARLGPFLVKKVLIVGFRWSTLVLDLRTVMDNAKPGPWAHSHTYDLYDTEIP